MAFFLKGKNVLGTDNSLEKIYERDLQTGSYIVAVAIDRYTDIFNELDPAPFKKRDLNPDLLIYLEDCSFDIPLKYSTILQFTVLNESVDPKKEERIIFGLKTYFSFIERQLAREITESYKKSAVYVVIAFLLLFASYSLIRVAENVVFVTALEVITIGGWVFLWEAISTFAFKKRETKSKRKHYKRFIISPIIFTHSANNVPVNLKK
ncbi:MAG: hypothetical protein NWF01_11240 [Candidatus Bathyarchaeota archaeon]|nr:hypothetical protein [Candidatus Bathyarchaeota archaeon]